MSIDSSFDNLTVTANAVQLTSAIIANISGNQVSNRLDGTPITERTISAIAASEINKAIEGSKNA